MQPWRKLFELWKIEVALITVCCLKGTKQLLLAKGKLHNVVGESRSEEQRSTADLARNPGCQHDSRSRGVVASTCVMREFVWRRQRATSGPSRRAGMNDDIPFDYLERSRTAILGNGAFAVGSARSVGASAPAHRSALERASRRRWLEA